jgi:hypothetical protein
MGNATGLSGLSLTGARVVQVERDIENREWKYVPGFLGVITEQEDAFIKVIEALYPTETVADRSSRDALRCVEHTGAGRSRPDRIPLVTSDDNTSTTFRGSVVDLLEGHDVSPLPAALRSYEAQNLYLELDNLREAAKFQRQRVSL